jgi:hypothetical protein
MLLHQSGIRTKPLRHHNLLPLDRLEKALHGRLWLFELCGQHNPPILIKRHQSLIKGPII